MVLDAISSGGGGVAVAISRQKLTSNHGMDEDMARLLEPTLSDASLHNQGHGADAATPPEDFLVDTLKHTPAAADDKFPEKLETSVEMRSKEPLGSE